MTQARTKNACSNCDALHMRKRFLADHDDMVQLFLAHGLSPLVNYPGNHKPWPSVHIPCGTRCAPYPSNVKHRGGGCETCARKTRGAARRIDEAAAVDVMRSAGLLPLVPYPTSGKPWLCLCSNCGEHATPTYDNVRAGTGGCRACGEYGLDWNGPAIVYVLNHNAWLSVKVGIARVFVKPGAQSRVDFLCARYGWVLYKRLLVGTGRAAYRVEQEVLRNWRHDLALPPHLGPNETQGHTETVSRDAISEESAWRQVKLLAAELR